MEQTANDNVRATSQTDIDRLRQQLNESLVRLTRQRKENDSERSRLQAEHATRINQLNESIESLTSQREENDSERSRSQTECYATSTTQCPRCSSNDATRRK